MKRVLFVVLLTMTAWFSGCASQESVADMGGLAGAYIAKKMGKDEGNGELIGRVAASIGKGLYDAKEAEAKAKAKATRKSSNLKEDHNRTKAPSKKRKKRVDD